MDPQSFFDMGILSIFFKIFRFFKANKLLIFFVIKYRVIYYKIDKKKFFLEIIPPAKKAERNEQPVCLLHRAIKLNRRFLRVVNQPTRNLSVEHVKIPQPTHQKGLL